MRFANKELGYFYHRATFEPSTYLAELPPVYSNETTPSGAPLALGEKSTWYYAYANPCESLVCCSFIACGAGANLSRMLT